MNSSCSRKLSRSSSSLKPPKADKTIELIKEIISNVSPLKISDIIREAIEPSVSIFEQQDLDSMPSMRKSRKSKSSKKQAGPQKKEKEIEKEQQEVNENSKTRRKIKLVKKEAELVCIPREEFEKEASITRIHDGMNKRKKYSTTSNESSFQCSPIKASSISGYTVMISDDEEENEKEPVKKLKISSFLTTDNKKYVGMDIQKEFGNTLSELGERLNNLTNLGNSMKTLSFLKKQSSVQKDIQDDHQQQQQHEPLEILNDFYSKVKQLYVEFGENLNQSK